MAVWVWMRLNLVVRRPVFGSFPVYWHWAGLCEFYTYFFLLVFFLCGPSFFVILRCCALTDIRSLLLFFFFFFPTCSISTDADTAEYLCDVLLAAANDDPSWQTQSRTVIVGKIHDTLRGLQGNSMIYEERVAVALGMLSSAAAPSRQPF